MVRKLSNLRVRELEIFGVVARAKSVREAARRLNITPGEVSKAIRGLEKKLELNLLRRSASGVVLSELGTQSAKHMEEILELVIKIQSLGEKKSQKTGQLLTVASTSFLITHLIAENFTEIFKNDEVNFRFMDLAPDQLITAGLRGAFEMAFHLGKQDWPRTWVSQKVGDIEWVLCARKKHPISEKADLEQILKFPFVQPTYWTTEGLMYGSDHFPATQKRMKGYETSTADAAIPILHHSNQLAFLPYPLVKSALKDIKIIECKDLKPVKKDLYLSVRSDMISANLHNKTMAHFKDALEKLG